MDEAANGIACPEVRVRDTGTTRGRGVYAARRFRVGELVEAAPVVVLDAPFERLPMVLQRMLFAWPVSRPGPGRHALALGYGSLYNGANPANMRYERDADHAVVRFFAARDIEPGEELTINYSAADGAPASRDDGWFVDHEVRPAATSRIDPA